MAASHMNPEEAVEAALDLQADAALAIHFGTFDLSDELLSSRRSVLKLLREKLYWVPEKLGFGYWRDPQVLGLNSVKMVKCLPALDSILRVDF